MNNNASVNRDIGGPFRGPTISLITLELLLIRELSTKKD